MIAKPVEKSSILRTCIRDIFLLLLRVLVIGLVSVDISFATDMPDYSTKVSTLTSHCVFDDERQQLRFHDSKGRVTRTIKFGEMQSMRKSKDGVPMSRKLYAYGCDDRKVAAVIEKNAYDDHGFPLETYDVIRFYSANGKMTGEMEIDIEAWDGHAGFFMNDDWFYYRSGDLKTVHVLDCSAKEVAKHTFRTSGLGQYFSLYISQNGRYVKANDNTGGFVVFFSFQTGDEQYYKGDFNYSTIDNNGLATVAIGVTDDDVTNKTIDASKIVFRYQFR